MIAKQENITIFLNAYIRTPKDLLVWHVASSTVTKLGLRVKTSVLPSG